MEWLGSCGISMYASTRDRQSASVRGSEADAETVHDITYKHIRSSSITVCTGSSFMVKKNTMHAHCSGQSLCILVDANVRTMHTHAPAPCTDLLSRCGHPRVTRGLQPRNGRVEVGAVVIRVGLEGAGW